ncbi:MAG: DUF1552 domain-containing protein [Planctomycetes bacterium]|nr:DUF1552 domain-containing protein [Planctomycetota bacterium]
MYHAPCSRRHFLRAGGVVLALPWLESLASAAEPGAKIGTAPKRMVNICANFGFYGPSFFPKEPGRDYEASEYSALLGDLRERFTIFSGISHPQIGGDHASEACFLTSAQRPKSPTFRNSISLDVLAAKHVGTATRFPLLTMATDDGPGLSYTASGAGIPPLQRPSLIFSRLFLAGKPDQVEAEVARLKRGQSILDRLGDRLLGLKSTLGAQDQRQLDDYNEAVRDMERQLQANQDWARRPKPIVEDTAPVDSTDRSDLIGRVNALFMLARLALRTDSTRVITIALKGSEPAPPIPGVTIGHHGLTHHGKDARKLEQLRAVERAEIDAVRQFLVGLRETTDGAGTLLDQTQVLLGSNLGDASGHGTNNLPILLAGGAWKHGNHIAGDPKKNTPLAQLYVSMLQQFGVETESFGSGNKTIAGLV